MITFFICNFYTFCLNLQYLMLLIVSGFHIKARSVIKICTIKEQWKEQLNIIICNHLYVFASVYFAMFNFSSLYFATIHSLNT